MYTPRLFQEQDPDRLFALMKANNFATLIVPDGSGIEIVHLPMVVDRASGELRMHVARGNRMWQLAAEGRTATAIFHGPHAYVTPRWYESPIRQVPTWNYAVVHAYGRLTGPMDGVALRRLLDELTAAHESDATEPWSVSMLDPDFAASLAHGIVGFTLRIEKVEGKLKLSQNRAPADQARVVAGLRNRACGDDLRLQELMKSVLGIDD